MLVSADLCCACSSCCSFHVGGHPNHIKGITCECRPVTVDVVLLHQVHLRLGLLQQHLLVLKIRGAHVFVDGLVLEVREAGQGQEGLGPLALEPGVLVARISLQHLYCLGGERMSRVTLAPYQIRLFIM